MKRGSAPLLIALYLALIVGGLLAGQLLTAEVDFDVGPLTEARLHAFVMTSTVSYILASAVPFVPGAEIGLAMMLMLGSKIVPLVYLSTVLALSLAFAIGRVVPARVTAAGFGMVGLHRAHDLVLRLEEHDTDARLRLLAARAPARIVPFLLRHRYLMLALAFNLPGNSLLGGGGGIALAAGLSRIYRPAAFVLTVMLAVAPVPIVFMLTGVRP